MCAQHLPPTVDRPQASTVSAFDHVGLSVRDLAEQADFYTRAFDLVEEFRFEIAEAGMSAIILRHADGWGVELLTREGSLPAVARTSPIDAVLDQGYGHLCLRFTEGLEDTYARFIEAGGTEVVPPQPGPHPQVVFSYAADPEGNLVEMIQYLPGFES